MKVFTNDSEEKLTVFINNINSSKYREKLTCQIRKYLNNNIINLIT